MGFCIFSKKERYLGPTLLGLARKVGGIRGQWNSLVRRRVFDCRNPCELDVFRKDSEILSFHFEKPSLESESAQSSYYVYIYINKLFSQYIYIYTLG